MLRDKINGEKNSYYNIHEYSLPRINPSMIIRYSLVLHLINTPDTCNLAPLDTIDCEVVCLALDSIEIASGTGRILKCASNTTCSESSQNGFFVKTNNQLKRRLQVVLETIYSSQFEQEVQYLSELVREMAAAKEINWKPVGLSNQWSKSWGMLKTNIMSLKCSS